MYLCVVLCSHIPIYSMNVCLGSKSTARRAILEKAGYSVNVMVPPEIDELEIGDRSWSGTSKGNAEWRSLAASLVEQLADAKMDALLTLSPQGILITSDTIVVVCGEILEKPSDETEARRMVALWSQLPGHAVSSICVVNTHTRKRATSHSTASFSVDHAFSEADVDAMLSQDFQRAAGCLIIESALVQPHVKIVDHLHTDGLDTVQGISTVLLAELVTSCSTASTPMGSGS